MTSNTLYIRNLSEKLSVKRLTDLLFDLFCPFGLILSIKVSKKLKLKGQAFLTYVDPSSCEEAIKYLNKSILISSKELIVDYAKQESRIAHTVIHKNVPVINQTAQIHHRNPLEIQNTS
jgi:RNA recognition motif-containing protein